MPILTDPSTLKKELALAARAKAAEPETDALVKYIDPAKAKNRMRFIADDSGSMTDHFQDVRDGLVEMLRNCIKDQDAVAIHMLCILDSENPMSVLESNLPKLAALVKTARFGGGSTPLFSTLKRVLETEPICNRVIVFTDGSPTDSILPYTPPSAALAFRHEADAAVIVGEAIEKKIPIDTIYFGSVEWGGEAIKLLKYLADKTGGYFLVFDPTKGVSLKSALKYLAPSQRLMLASESFRKELESGKKI